MIIKNNENLEIYRLAAQFFTMVSAVAYGLLWFVVGIAEIDSSAIETFSDALLICTVIGGIVMGLLYVAKTTRQRKRKK